MAEEKKVNAPAKATAVALKKDDSKPGFFKRIGKWFREMRSELKKVIWPTRKELVKNSLVSLAFMVISGLVIWGFDFVASKLVELLFLIAG